MADSKGHLFPSRGSLRLFRRASRTERDECRGTRGRNFPSTPDPRPLLVRDVRYVGGSLEVWNAGILEWWNTDWFHHENLYLSENRRGDTAGCHGFESVSASPARTTRLITNWRTSKSLRSTKTAKPNSARRFPSRRSLLGKSIQGGVKGPVPLASSAGTGLSWRLRRAFREAWAWAAMENSSRV